MVKISCERELLKMESKDQLKKDATILVSYVSTLDNFAIVDEMDGAYNHMGATITDAILQAGINYKTVVAPRAEKLKISFPEAKTTSGFLSLLERTHPSELLNFHGRKADLILEVTRFFQEQNLQNEQGLFVWLHNENNVEQLKMMKGIGNKTADYFKILTGIDTSAIDTHLFDFLAEAGIKLKKDEYLTAKAIVDTTAEMLGKSKALFDHSIWKYMSEKLGQKNKPKAEQKTTGTEAGSSCGTMG
jgi:hypothetical protein